MTVVASVSRAQFCLRPHRHAVLVSVTDSSIAVTAFIIIKRLFQSVTDCMGPSLIQMAFVTDYEENNLWNASCCSDWDNLSSQQGL
jgi:hypothetical protein